MSVIATDSSRFYDPSVGTHAPMRIELERKLENDRETWALQHQIAYRDRHFDQPFIVPKDCATWRTDLTSVPDFFTWLVPKTGTHLPAALLHDGLTVDAGLPPEHIGPPVTSVEADRIFRDAMADLGTPQVRRWLVWSAVSLRSVATLGWAKAAPAYLSLVVVLVLGVIATVDLIDWWDALPWMGDRPWWREVLYGATAAVLVPVGLALAWVPAGLYRAGLICSWALALLLHLTLVVLVLTGVYRILEWLVPRPIVLTIVVLVAAVAAFLVAFVIG